MKISKKQTIGENLLYLMVWSAIILVPVLNSQMMSEMHVNIENVLIAWRQIFPYLLVFIIHNSILAPRYMLRHRYWKYLFLNALLVCAVFGLVDLYEGLPHANPSQPLAQGEHTASFSNLEIYWNIVLAIFMTSANSGIKLMYQSIRDEQKMEELKRQNLQAEMEYLKYQINPHFFMNTLNNIHALIDIDTECAKNTVIELSKMMRYVLYDSGNEKISLERDIQFLENYIELMRIRYTDAIDIKVEYPQNIGNQISIPPLLLIVFIENAFKHGVSYNHSSFIHLNISYAENKVHCTVTNSRHAAEEKNNTTGIGLENVRKRLELIYGHRNYTLDIRKDEQVYQVKLVIPTLNA